MKKNTLSHITILKVCFGILISFMSSFAFSQIAPPGYDREVLRQKELASRPYLDRDSVTMIDTIEVFDPTTYESEVRIVTAHYSLREYCREFLNMNDPEILMDKKPHTIVDPETFEDLIIQLNPAGKIDTLPKPH